MHKQDELQLLFYFTAVYIVVFTLVAYYLRTYQVLTCVRLRAYLHPYQLTDLLTDLRTYARAYLHTH